MSSIIKIKQKGNLNKSTSFFRKFIDLYDRGILDEIAIETVILLKKETPRTMDDEKIHVADQWDYIIKKENNKISIIFTNDSIVGNTNIAIILDEGHMSTSGKWVSGKHYIQEPINIAIDRIKEELRKD